MDAELPRFEQGRMGRRRLSATPGRLMSAGPDDTADP
jgi:hypothetical protein